MRPIFTLSMLALANHLFANDYSFSHLGLTCQSPTSVKVEFSVPSEYNTMAYLVSISYNALDWQTIDTIYSQQSESLPSAYTQYYEGFDSLPRYAKVTILNFDWFYIFDDITSLTCISNNENKASYTIKNNHIHIYSHVVEDITADFFIYDLNLNQLHVEEIHFVKGYNHHQVNYSVELFISYIFICRSNAMMQCHRMTSVAD